jgi:ribosomal protein S18 acetylase RimI-like enzyme
MTDAIPIRTARRADVPSLLVLWGAMVEENATLDPRLSVHADARERMVRTFTAWLDDPTRVVLVAEESSRVVIGFAAGTLGPGNGLQVPARLGQITDCYVIPARRRRGAGRRLSTRLLDALREKGADAVRLQVVAKNADAQAFWHSLGFELLEEVLEASPRTAMPSSRTGDR